MGFFEIIFWIAIIIFSILRGMQSNKKTPVPQDSSPEGRQLDPLQQAIREIEAALRAPEQPASTPDNRSTFEEVTPRQKSNENVYESEFHSMESQISRRNLEKETSFDEFYSDKSLESTSTYEDSFPVSTFYDDAFKHAHPTEPTDTPRKKPQDRVQSIKKRLKNKNDLADAIVLQTILNRRTFPPGRG